MNEAYGASRSGHDGAQSVETRARTTMPLFGMPLGFYHVQCSTKLNAEKIKSHRICCTEHHLSHGGLIEEFQRNSDSCHLRVGKPENLTSDKMRPPERSGAQH
jgi:hypothetical protein